MGDVDIVEEKFGIGIRGRVFVMIVIGDKRASTEIYLKANNLYMNVPKYLIIHHTGGSDSNPLQDSSNFTFEQCNELHKVNFNMISSLGYYVGYQYYISKDGTVKQARLDTDEGAHTKGYNSQSIGICLAGNFDATYPTQAQIDSLKKLINEKAKQYNIGKESIVPHRKFAVKTCYGNRLADDWAAKLLDDAPVLSKEERIAKAAKLLTEAMELLKGIV